MLPFIQFSEIHIGPLALQVWGLMLFLGICAGALIFEKSLRAGKIFLPEVSKYALYASVIGGGLVGGRLLHVWEYADRYKNLADIFRVYEGGMAIYGGLIGGMAGLWLWAKISGNDFRLFAGWASLPAAAVLFFGRIGCSLINDHPGALTALPWGIKWPNGAIRHPVAEYEILLALAIFFILKKVKVRQRAEYFFWLYAPVRFLLDFMRATDIRFWHLTASQWISVAIIAVFLLFWIWKSAKDD